MPDNRKNKPGMEVYWTTVTYKSVFLMAIGAIALILAGWWVVHPNSLKKVWASIRETVAGDPEKQQNTQSNQARFSNLDGRVQVRKIGSMQFVNATLQMTLEKGDVIQTGSDGIGRISFANGTTYTVQADTLITVESSTGAAGQAVTPPSVSVKSGAVDLSTTTSPAEVAFEDAVARVNQNSRAEVRTDPESKQHAITMQSGSGDVRRGGQMISIAPYERVSFETGGEANKTRILAPPDLVAPLNLQPLLVDNPRQFALRFEWKPVPEAVDYYLRVSTSSTFSQLAADRRVTATSVTINGLAAGDYYWVVTARDPKRGESQASEVFKFVLAEQGKGQSMLLEMDKPILHGTVVEINGRTEPGAALIINGQTVPRVGPDGRFQYFTPPMQRGSQTIRIQGQNRRGGVASKEVPIFIP